MTGIAGLDRARADLASVIFDAWRQLGRSATPQNASGEIARAVLDAGWQLAADVQWGYRSVGETLVVEASEATARLEAAEPGNELVRRPVGPWEVVKP